MRTEHLICAGMLALFALDAPAALYKWVDENGRVQYSDKPPVQAGKGGVEMSSRGVVKKKLDAEPTSEEKKAQELEAARRHAEQQEALAQRRADNALLQSFTTVQEIDMKRDRELQAIEALTSNLRAQERTLLERLNDDRRRTDVQTKKARPPADDSRQDLARAQAELNTVRTQIQRKNQEAAETRIKYEALRKRYIELRQSGADVAPAAAGTTSAQPQPQKPSRK